MQNNKEVNAVRDPEVLVPDWLLNIYKEVGLTDIRFNPTSLESN